MTTALRPMSTGEILDRAFNIYRNNFALFAGIAILAPAMKLVFDVGRFGFGLNPARALAPATLSDYIPILGVSLLIAITGGTLASAATVYAVSMVHLGNATTIAESYKRIGPHFGKLLLLVLLIMILFVGIAMLVVIPAVLSINVPDMETTFGIVTLVGVLVAVVLMVHFYARLSLSMASCVLERIGAVAAIRRSNFLSKGATGRIWLILILMGVINLALSFAITAPTLAASTAAHLTFLMTAILLSCGQFIATSLAAPIVTVSMVLVYYDQRVRKEAFDLQLMMEGIGQSGSGQTAAAPIG